MGNPWFFVVRTVRQSSRIRSPRTSGRGIATTRQGVGGCVFVRTVRPRHRLRWRPTVPMWLRSDSPAPPVTPGSPPAGPYTSKTTPVSQGMCSRQLTIFQAANAHGASISCPIPCGLTILKHCFLPLHSRRPQRSNGLLLGRLDALLSPSASAWWCPCGRARS